MIFLSMMLAAAVRFESGEQRVALVELYTSEGCSSCPPADRWLAALRQAPGLWKDFVPVAFHVNYWDKLGWRDRLSTGAFTQREYGYAAAWGSASVYTPCFVLDGKEYHPSAGAPGPESARAGALSLTADPKGIIQGGQVIVTFLERTAPDAPAGGQAMSRLTADVSRPHLTAHVALLAGGVSNHVLAGENAGSTLTHEFVVISLGTGDFTSSPGDPAKNNPSSEDRPAAPGSFVATVSMPAPVISNAPRYALAAWLTEGDSLVPLQAVGGWLGR